MKELTCDIHIVGGALSGLLTAYCASDLGYKIIISEKKNIQKSVKKQTGDIRTTAIAEGSKLFLESQGLWRLINKFAEPIKDIKVIEKKTNTKLDFTNPLTKSNLGYIVKNSNLIYVLIKELRKKKNVNFITGSAIKFINYSKGKIISFSNNSKITSNLIVAADGKNGDVKKISGTNYYVKKYKEKALVVNFFHDKPHKNIAYEFFFKNGPLAILPMQNENKKHQSTLIWSNKESIVDFLANSNLQKEYVEEIINEKIYDKLGNLTGIASIQSFPLSAHINERFYEKKIIFIGDSAHSIHPIAGQGWNLGLRDIRSLTKLLIAARDTDLEIGTKDFCKSYNNHCYYDAYRLFEITDKLDWIFKRDDSFFKLIKKIGFATIDKNRTLKEKIVNFAMGIN